MKYIGSCKCKKITFELKGLPEIQYNCHCDDCKNFTGSSYASFLAYKKENILVSGAKPKEYMITLPDGKRSTNEFCKDCGSGLFHRAPDSFDLISIKLGSLENFQKFECAIEFFTSKRMSHISAFEGAQQFKKMT